MSDWSRYARRQHAVVTREQVLESDSRSQLERHLLRGRLEVRYPGVYVVSGSTATYEQAVMAAALAVGDAWASHRTAAKLWGLLVPPPQAIDVLTLPARSVRLAGVQHHRNKLIAIQDVSVRHGIPVTSVARTLGDCIPWLPGSRLAAAVDDARRRGLLDIEDLAAAHLGVDEGSRTGRRRVVPMRPVLARRLEGQEPGGSERELAVLEVLRSAGLPPPVQQHPIVVAGRTRYLDYAYVPERIFLEFDGFAEHGLIRSVFDDDRERDTELGLMGWLGLHFTSATRPDDLVSRVARALAARAA
ncbi:MAG: uncharacterized protein JWN67_3039 [Actinomycetia bacterium]|nr:uncharacterized protein [Actinomycetes bacterium]